MSELKIKISIANRVYPLTILREEEEGIRAAARRIEKVLRDFEANYAVRDKQDLLAMAALQFATELENIHHKNLVVDEALEDRLRRLEDLVSSR